MSIIYAGQGGTTAGFNRHENANDKAAKKSPEFLKRKAKLLQKKVNEQSKKNKVLKKSELNSESINTEEEKKLNENNGISDDFLFKAKKIVEEFNKSGTFCELQNYANSALRAEFDIFKDFFAGVTTGAIIKGTDQKYVVVPKQGKKYVVIKLEFLED